MMVFAADNSPAPFPESSEIASSAWFQKQRGPQLEYAHC